MSFDEDPNDQANISGADFAIMCDELASLRRQLAEAQARLAELEGQEPIGVIQHLHGAASISWSPRDIANFPHNTLIYANAAPSPADQKDAALLQAATDVLAERHRQQDVEGWTPDHDDEHATGAMAAAAACYALWASAPSAENAYWHAAREEAAKLLWPWDREWWKPQTPRRDLVKAGALILAEIARLDRAPAKQILEGGE